MTRTTHADGKGRLARECDRRSLRPSVVACDGHNDGSPAASSCRPAHRRGRGVATGAGSRLMRQRTRRARRQARHMGALAAMLALATAGVGTARALSPPGGVESGRVCSETCGAASTTPAPSRAVHEGRRLDHSHSNAKRRLP